MGSLSLPPPAQRTHPSSNHPPLPIGPPPNPWSNIYCQEVILRCPLLPRQDFRKKIRSRLEPGSIWRGPFLTGQILSPPVAIHPPGPISSPSTIRPRARLPQRPTSDFPFHAAGGLSAAYHPQCMDAPQGPQPVIHEDARRSSDYCPTRGPSQDLQSQQVLQSVLKPTSFLGTDRVRGSSPKNPRTDTQHHPEHRRSSTTSQGLRPLPRKRKGHKESLSRARARSDNPRPQREVSAQEPAQKAAQYDIQPGVSTGHSSFSRDSSAHGHPPHPAVFTSTPLAHSCAPSPTAPTSARQARSLRIPSGARLAQPWQSTLRYTH